VRRTVRGFSLIELLVVVAIILILMAIAIPNFLRAHCGQRGQRRRKLSNHFYRERRLLDDLRRRVCAIPVEFRHTTSGNVSAISAGLLDNILVTGTKSGYVFTYVPLTPDSNGYFNDYTLNADPLIIGVTGQRHFFTDEPAVIRVNLTVPASDTDPPL
jgi:type IV pilus assembly protein PilA